MGEEEKNRKYKEEQKKETVKIFEDDLKVISDDNFRRVRGGKEPTPPGKQSNKPWQK